MKIYTKTGDKGKTRLIGGQEVPKSDLRVEAYGTVDELNSCLGLIINTIASSSDLIPAKQQLEHIQNELFNLGSQFACGSPELIKQMPQLLESHIQTLEQAIDKMTAELPPLTKFILPGGGTAASFCHLARTICRRAERQSVAMSTQGAEIEMGIKYLNRLSDYLFVLARYFNFKENIPDQLWKK